MSLLLRAIYKIQTGQELPQVNIVVNLINTERSTQTKQSWLSNVLVYGANTLTNTILITLDCLTRRAQDDESDTEEDYVNRRAMASSPPPKRIRVVENGPSHSNSLQPDPQDEGLEGMGQADDVKLEESDQV